MYTEFFYMFDDIENYLRSLDKKDPANQRIFDGYEAIDMYNSIKDSVHPLESEYKDMRDNKYVAASAVLDYWWAIKFVGENIRKDEEIIACAAECFRNGIRPEFHDICDEKILNFMRNANNKQIAKVQQLTDEGITCKDACELFMDPSLSPKQMDIIADAFIKDNPPSISISDNETILSFTSNDEQDIGEEL